MRFNICTFRSFGLSTRIRHGASKALGGYAIEPQAEWSTVPVFRGNRCQEVLSGLDLEAWLALVKDEDADFRLAVWRRDLRWA